MASVLISEDSNFLEISKLAGADPMSCSYSKGILHIGGVSQEALDMAIAAYSSDLETYLLKPLRKKRSDHISRRAYEFISSKYPVQVQQMFQALLTEAHISGMVNRMTYIQQMLSWAKTIAQATIDIDNQLDVANSRQDILAIDLDFTPFELSDPSITIKASLEISD